MLNSQHESIPEGVFDDVMQVVTHKVMLHMAPKRGLKEFGVKGEEAVLTELLQIHMQNTFVPRPLMSSHRCKSARHWSRFCS